MLRAIYKDIENGKDVRKNLIELKKLLKEESNKRAFIYYLAGDYSLFYKLLENEDAKSRKNTVLIMGDIGEQSFVSVLYEAYQKEETLFVKPSYLEAITQLDYRFLLEDLKERLETLTKSQFDEASMKHINEEVKNLTRMIIDIEGRKEHRFIGSQKLSDVILLTNRDHQKVTIDQIENMPAKEFGAGVMVRTEELKKIQDIRTYSELLFRLPNLEEMSDDPVEITHALYKAGIVDFLDTRHEGGAPYYFRLEIKAKITFEQKSAMAKKVALNLEKISKRKLINSTSNYEVEIRLIENKKGMFNALLKLYTIKDNRFEYRKHSVAASIAPHTAALVARLAKGYLKEGVQVLDPFCGVGTMLIERNKLVQATPIYGIDTFGEAIDRGIINSRAAKCNINFINKDFFDFTHNYFFDEIFTNMPTRGGRKTEAEMVTLYKSFFNKSMEVLKSDGLIVMYTRDRHLVVGEVPYRPEFTILEEYTISKKEEAYVFIIKKN